MDLSHLIGRRGVYLQIGHPPGHESGITYYAFTDNNAVAKLFREEHKDLAHIYGFVQEILSQEGGIIPFPFNSYVPVTITSHQVKGNRLSLGGCISSSTEIDGRLRVLDQKKFELKLNL
ncbi:hypothetical protein J4479_00595 [Candidatus Woesearchaeota archaeon]|nr:hypothetical protein [Candidatus Woesearchaeota archaeon]